MIGILDSGLGGISTLLSLKALSPDTDIVYLADQAHAPYGERSPSELLGYLEAAIRFFAHKGVEALLLACGTLSAVALPKLKSAPPFPIFSVIEPAAKEAAKHTKTGVAILATTATVQSGVYPKALLSLGVKQTLSVACPLLVPLIENGFLTESLAAKEILSHYLAPAKTMGCDTLLLGCTHYGFLSPLFSRLWKEVYTVDAGKVLAKDALSKISPKQGQGKTLFYTTGNPTTFLKKTSALLSLPHLTVYGTEGKGI